MSKEVNRVDNLVEVAFSRQYIIVNQISVHLSSSRGHLEQFTPLVMDSPQ